LKDRNREDFLAETEYIRYLYENGSNVSNAVNSCNGNLVEEVVYDNRTFYICVFEKAKGKMLVENNYRYREGAPLSEYFYNCGKVLGKMHQLSKEYVLADGSRPVHRRCNFSDKFNAEYIDKLIPDSLSLLKEKLFGLLKALSGLDKGNESYGMIHFDYNDGNYNIDFETGEITVYDFDNCCFGWYLFDLAGVWTHGVGWIQFEKDPVKRKAFMDDYWETVLAGYRSETYISDKALENFQLFLQAELMENIVEYFGDMYNFSEKPRSDEELSYLIKCLEDDIPYRGFFHDMYSCDEPFEYEARDT